MIVVSLCDSSVEMSDADPERSMTMETTLAEQISVEATTDDPERTETEATPVQPPRKLSASLVGSTE